MAESLTNAGELYSPMMGLVYVFNLIVGTGALTMPKAFASAGWILGIILISVLSFMSYLTTTFVIEVMAIANAILRHQRKEREGNASWISESSEQSSRASSVNSNLESPIYPSGIMHRTSISAENLYQSLSDHANENNGEKEPLLNPERLQRKYNKRSNRSQFHSNPFKITERVEMGQMADMFFNRIGRTLFYLCIAIYLYGDLAIYAAAVPKSLRDIACGNMSCSSGNSSAMEPSDSDLCWPNVTRGDAYRIFVAVFILLLGPFTFFNIQKTKYLQITTSLFRWLAFGMMIILTIIHIAQGNAVSNPKTFDIKGVPTLFGVAVYSFMCQHSLPSLITPIREKRYLSGFLAVDYILILSFYILLCLTAVFAFNNSHLMDMYTLNFQDSCDVTDVTFIRYFLGLFPVFTLSTSFPIIAVTLKNNLKAMFHCSRTTPYPFFIDRILFPLVTIVPPVTIAFITNDLTALVGYTGSYAGTGVQYIIPACLVLIARRDANNTLGAGMTARNISRSPFKRRIWIILVFLWSFVCLAFVTVNHIVSFDDETRGNLTESSWLSTSWSWLNIRQYFFTKSD